MQCSDDKYDDNARYAGKEAMLTDISGGLTRALGGPSLGGPPLSHWTNNVSKPTIMSLRSLQAMMSAKYSKATWQDPLCVGHLLSRAAIYELM